MNKKSITILGIAILVILTGSFWFFQKNTNNVIPTNIKISQEDNTEVIDGSITEVKNDNLEKKENIKDIEELNFEEVDTSDWKTYRNEEYGFEVNLPGNSVKWNIEEKNVLQINSFFNSGSERYLDFRYKLDNRILNDKNDTSLGFDDEMSLWYINIIPINNYVENVCEKYKKPMCRQGEILGQNDQFVFIAGFTNIEGAGYLCNNQHNKQWEFCNVDNYFGLKNINNLINFRVL